MPRPPIRLGTRGSKLALWQAEWVAARLAAIGQEVQLVSLSTRGDQETVHSIEKIAGGEGVFTKEIQRALLDERVDLAVHSLKDLPTEVVAGLTLAAIPPRESSADVLVGRTAAALAELPASARVGTSSLRRTAQLLHLRGDLEMAPIRGNVDTRLRRLDEGQYDAIVLAEAGLVRLGLAERITHRFAPSELLPAIGQGALGVECREDDGAVRMVLERLDHPPTRQAVLAERTLLATLRGGCLAPIGALAQHVDGKLVLSAAVLSGDGRRRLFASRSAPPDDFESLGRQVAGELLNAGADELIEESRGTP